MSRRGRLAALACAIAAVVVPSAGAGSTATQYLVVFKPGHSGQGVRAVARAGGQVVRIDRVGVGTATSSNPRFAQALRASGKVAGVAHAAAWHQPRLRLAPARGLEATNPPTAPAGCAQQYQPPGGVGVGPDVLSVCQWDMRIINASPTGSYAVNRGRGTRVGDLDTGIDATHPDIAPNLDVAHSCSFIKPGNPTAVPQEIAPTGRACGASEVSKWQDYDGHGTHTAGTIGAPINGIGVAGVAPETTLVALKVCTANGFCFTQEVVDGLIEAGDLGLDVANMSFFADPFLLNCHNVAEEQAIVKAVSRAADYAVKRGVVLVASAGNDSIDLDHPARDADYTQPDQTVGNQCVVVPAELPGVATITAIGPARRLSFYSTVSNSKVDVTAPGGSSGQAPNPYGRVLSSYSSTGHPITNPTRKIEDCETVGGTPVCALYGWIQGTSMAAPHASGVAALIRAAHPGMPPLAVIAALQKTAMPMACGGEAEADVNFADFGPPPCTGTTNAKSNGGQTSYYGNGLVDALAAGTR
jgi:subtilisin family serine protease